MGTRTASRSRPITFKRVSTRERGSVSCLLTFILCLAAIKNALRQQNLNPEIEEKLLNLQRYQEQQLKDGADAPYTYTPIQTIHSTSTVASSSHRKRVIRRHHDHDDDDDHDEELDDGAIPEDDDDEDWFAHKRRRKPYVPRSERAKALAPRNSSPFIRPKQNEDQQQQQAPPRIMTSNVPRQQQQGTVMPIAIKPQPHLVTLKPKQTIVQPQATVTSQKVVNQNSSGSEMDKSQELSEKLATHSDMLRDSMLRKRETLEEELKQEIRQELDSTLEVIQGSASAGSGNQENESLEMENNKYSARKRASGGSSRKRDDSQSADDCPPKPARMQNSSAKGASASSKKAQRSHQSSGAATAASGHPSTSRKKEKLYCVCQTPYDDSK